MLPWGQKGKYVPSSTSPPFDIAAFSFGDLCSKTFYRLILLHFQYTQLLSSSTTSPLRHSINIDTFKFSVGIFYRSSFSVCAPTTLSCVYSSTLALFLKFFLTLFLTPLQVPFLLQPLPIWSTASCFYPSHISLSDCLTKGHNSPNANDSQIHSRPNEKTKAFGWTAQMYRLKKVWVEVFSARYQMGHLHMF